MKKATQKSNILEKLGFSLSFICALHCLATPFLLAFLPAFGELFPEEIELAVIVISFAIAIRVIKKDTHTHKQILPLVLVISSFLVLILANIFAKNHIWDIVGLAGIMAAYLLNWYKLRKARVCACA